MDLAEFPRFLERTGRKVFSGLMWFKAPGHMVEEFDRISRILYLDKELGKAKPFVIIPPTEQTNLIQKVFEYSGVPVQFITHINAWEILREIEIHYPELTIPVGQSHFYYGPSNGDKKPNMSMAKRLGHAKEFSVFCNESSYFYELISRTEGYNVFKAYFSQNLSSSEFIDNLQAEEKKICCIQVKKLYNNAVGSELSLENCMDLVGRATDFGYKVVLAGRDPLPDEMKKFAIFDYATSQEASFYNDFLLASMTETAFFYSSGICHIFENFVTSMVQLKCWRVIPYFYSNTIMCTAKVIDSSSGSVLNIGGLARITEDAWQPHGYAFSNLSGHRIADYSDKEVERIFDAAINIDSEKFDHVFDLKDYVHNVWRNVKSKVIIMS